MQLAGFNVSTDGPCIFLRRDVMNQYDFPLKRYLSLQSTGAFLCYVLWVWHSEVCRPQDCSTQSQVINFD